MHMVVIFFFFSSRRRHTRCSRDWSSDVCSSDLCRLECRLELGLVRRRLPSDTEAAVGAEDAEPAGGGTRPGDQEVDETVLGRLGGGLGRTELEKRTLQLVASGARRTRDAKEPGAARVPQ